MHYDKKEFDADYFDAGFNACDACDCFCSD